LAISSELILEKSSKLPLYSTHLRDAIEFTFRAKILNAYQVTAKHVCTVRGNAVPG